MASAQQLTVPRQDGVQVPVTVFDAGTMPCAPLAILSPGAGGTEKNLRYLAKGLHKNGWTAIIIGHLESGPAALHPKILASGFRDGYLELTTSSEAYEKRFEDIAATLRWASHLCKPPFTALLGHSMGAATVMLEAGAKNRLGLTGQDRFDAYVAMSPQGPGSIFPPKAWSEIHKPVLILTGTRDNALEGDWKSRTIPFSDMPAGNKALGVIDRATHINFAGLGFSWRTQRISKRVISAFLDNLRGGHCGSLPKSAGINIQTK